MRATRLTGWAIFTALAGGAACSSSDSIPPSGVVVASVAPPAISGGTLAISSDGATAVAADPDRDRVWIVDLTARVLIGSVALQSGDEPGRVVIDGKLAHVVLRGAGAVATIDLASGAIVRRTQVCGVPRGAALDAKLGVLYVACGGGELVTLSSTGTEIRRLLLDRDLRDVVVQGDHVFVSRFRSAEVIALDAKGTEIGRTKPLSWSADAAFGGNVFQPGVAWRMVALPNGGVALSHQRESTGVVTVTQQYYSEEGCDPAIAQSVVSTLYPDGIGTPSASCAHSVDTTGAPLDPACDPCVATVCAQESDCCNLTWDDTCTAIATECDATMAPIGPSPLIFAALPVDVAVSPDGSSFAVAMAGSSLVVTSPFGTTTGSPAQCTGPDVVQTPTPGAPIAVAFAPNGNLVAQIREPSSLVINGVVLTLPGESRVDTGHDLFHTAPKAQGSLACASCHPEGGDDAIVWNFAPSGNRRTQNLRGGILSTAPFHWSGDLSDMTAVMGEVFTKRMGGPTEGPAHINALAHWVDSIPALPVIAPTDTGAVARGGAVFADAGVGCTSCHSGAKLTNNQTVDVGTGTPLQVPSLLGLAYRAPYLHDGCAASLIARFSPSCGGTLHGNTSTLTGSQIDDLVAYLDSL